MQIQTCLEKIGFVKHLPLETEQNSLNKMINRGGRSDLIKQKIRKFFR